MKKVQGQQAVRRMKGGLIRGILDPRPDTRIAEVYYGDGLTTGLLLEKPAPGYRGVVVWFRPEAVGSPFPMTTGGVTVGIRNIEFLWSPGTSLKEFIGKIVETAIILFEKS